MSLSFSFPHTLFQVSSFGEGFVLTILREPLSLSKISEPRAQVSGLLSRPPPVKTPPYKGARARSIRVWCSLTPTRGFSSVQFSSVAQLCQTLCNPMDFSMPGLPVYHQLPELTQTHVHRISDAIQPASSVIPVSSHLQSFPASGSFQMSRFFSSGGQSIGVSASASVLPMNSQD